MILLHIISENEEQAIEVVDFLLEESLLLDAVCMEKIILRKKGDSGHPKSIPQTLIMGKTKALLFNTIDEILKDKYGANSPTIYSVPIVHMDWEQSKQLVNEITKV